MGGTHIFYTDMGVSQAGITNLYCLLFRSSRTITTVAQECEINLYFIDLSRQDCPLEERELYHAEFTLSAPSAH